MPAVVEAARRARRADVNAQTRTGQDAGVGAAQFGARVSATASASFAAGLPERGSRYLDSRRADAAAVRGARRPARIGADAA